jgi:hypothetical protein
MLTPWPYRDVLDENKSGTNGKMVPLYAARIEDLGPGDFVKVDCGGCWPKAPSEFARTPMLAYGAAFHGIPVAARPQPTGQGARLQGSGEVSRLRCARSCGRVDQVGEVRRVSSRLGKPEAFYPLLYLGCRTPLVKTKPKTNAPLALCRYHWDLHEETHQRKP